MKRIFVSLSFMLAVGLTTAFAGDKTDVNSKIVESFKKEFEGAELVKWDKVEDYQKATFVFHEHRVIAYFDEYCEFLGSARTILFDQLPMAVVKSFDTHFAGADFSDVSEVSNIEGTSYCMTIETQNKQYHVKINSNGNILKAVKIK